MLFKVAFQSRKIFSRVACTPNRFWNFRERRKKFIHRSSAQLGRRDGQRIWVGQEGINFLRAFVAISGIQQKPWASFLAQGLSKKSNQEHSTVTHHRRMGCYTLGAKRKGNPTERYGFYRKMGKWRASNALVEFHFYSSLDSTTFSDVNYTGFYLKH